MRKEDKIMLTLYELPIEGAFAVYKLEGYKLTKLFARCYFEDIPEEYRNLKVIKIYPYDDSIIVEVI